MSRLARAPLEWLRSLLPPSHRESLLEALLSADNPISVRDSRRFARRGEPWLFLGGALAIVLLVVLIAFGIVWFILHHGGLRRGIPAFLGGSRAGLFAVVVSGVHALTIQWAAQRWSGRFFLAEYRQNTLEPLLLTLTSPFALVAQAAARPLRMGLLAAAAGLPFYALALTCGGIGWLDVSCLYVLFAMMALQVPPWEVPALAGTAYDVVKKTHKMRRSSTWTEQWVRTLPFLMIWGNGFFSSVLGPNWLFALVAPLWQELPREVTRLAPAFVLSWPLMVARVLAVPLPFYCAAIPPILIVLPLRLAGRVVRIWEVSFYLSVGDVEEMSALRDFPAYWRLRGACSFATALAILGYAWTPYVEHGRTAYLVRSAGGSIGTALAGLVWLFGAWAVLETWGRARSAARSEQDRSANGNGNGSGSHRSDRLRTLGWQFQPLGRAAVLYVCACVLALRWPVPAEAGLIAAQLAVLAAVGSVWLRARRVNGWWYTGALLLPWLGWLLPDAHAGARIAAFSPLTGLLALAEPSVRFLHSAVPGALMPSWAMSCVASGALGVVALLLRRVAPVHEGAQTPGIRTWLPGGRAATAGEFAAAPGSAFPLPGGVPTLDAKPAQSRTTLAAQARQRPPKQEYPVAQRLLGLIGRRTDNPLTIKEVRVLLRGHLGRAEIVTYALLLLGPLALCVYHLSAISEELAALGALLFGTGAPETVALFAGSAASWACVLALIVPLLVLYPCAAAFVKERDKSTLAFILSTPMSTWRIVLGKLCGASMPAWTCYAVGAAWITALSVPVAFAAGPVRWLAGLGVALSLPAAVALMSASLSLLFGTLLRKENDAGVVAFVVLLVVVYFGGVFGFYLLEACGLAVSGGPIAEVLHGVALAMAALSLLVTPACLALTCWRIERMRHRDMATEGAGKPA